MEPWTIGNSVSSGCIRMINQDVLDLYGRIPLGTKVIVLGNAKPEVADRRRRPDPIDDGSSMPDHAGYADPDPQGQDEYYADPDQEQ